MSGGQMLLEFDRHGRKFADGFECGRIWALLREYPDSEVSEIVHARNAEMFIRMAEATQREFSSVDADDQFVEVTFGPSEGNQS